MPRQFKSGTQFSIRYRVQPIRDGFSPEYFDSVDELNARIKRELLVNCPCPLELAVVIRLNDAEWIETCTFGVITL